MALKVFLAILMLLIGSAAYGQSTAVSATITDTDGQTWNNGSFVVTFVPKPGTPGPYTCNGNPITTQQTGFLSGAGFMSVSLCPNTSIAPGGSQWAFTVTPNASAPAGTVNVTVVGSTMDLSTVLSSGVPAPRFHAGINQYGYLDVEVSPVPVPGGQYWNVTTNCLKTWSGTAWNCVAGGGGASSPPIDSIQISDGSGGFNSYPGDVIDPATGDLSVNCTSTCVGSISGNATTGQIDFSVGITTPKFNLGNSPAFTGFGKTLDFSVYGHYTTDYTIPFTFELYADPPNGASAFQITALDEGFIPTTNTANMTSSQFGHYSSFSDFGSGTDVGVYGGAFEGFNSGPATVQAVYGVSGRARCGGVNAGFPVQIATNNGNCTNMNGGIFTALNTSSGIATSAVGGFFQVINQGAGSIGTGYGILVDNINTAGTNYSLYTQSGIVRLGDSVLALNGINVGNSNTLANVALYIGNNPQLTGTSQNLLQATGPGSSSATTTIAGIFRADIAAGATASSSTGLLSQTPVIGSGASLANWRGLAIQQAPTVGTSAHSIELDGSTSGVSYLDPPAVGTSAVNVLPSINGVLAVTSQLPLSGTTGTITGTSLTATCDSGTATVTGAVVGSPVSVSATDGSDVGGAFYLRASVTSSNTVTVYICGTGTPSSKAYNVRVIQ